MCRDVDVVNKPILTKVVKTSMYMVSEVTRTHRPEDYAGLEEYSGLQCTTPNICRT